MSPNNPFYLASRQPATRPTVTTESRNSSSRPPAVTQQTYTLRRRIAQLKERNHALKHGNDTLEDEVERQRGFHDSITEAYETLDKSKQRLAGELKDKNEEIHALKKEISRCQVRDEAIAKEAAQDRNKDDEIRQLQNDIKQAGRLLSERDNEIEKLRRQASRAMREQDHKIERLRGEITHTQSDAEQIQTKDDEIQKLRKELLQYKRTASASTQLAGQMTDTTICDKINGLFYAVSNWALEVARQGDMG
jgi:chromosome segregation ATPase